MMTQHENKSSTVNITKLHFEHLSEALGIGISQPRLSWIVEGGKNGWAQSAYELEAYTSDGKPRGQTGRVGSQSQCW